jgi:hypothetical protein
MAERDSGGVASWHDRHAFHNPQVLSRSSSRQRMFLSTIILWMETPRRLVYVAYHMKVRPHW